MKIKRKLANIGVEYDIKLKDLSDKELIDWSKNLTKENIVLVRNQNLDRSDLVRICKTIGNPCKAYEHFSDEEFPEIIRISNKIINGKKIGTVSEKYLDWHTTASGRTAPGECSDALYCVEPGIGSITSFCDTRQAYYDLPDEMKIELEKITCLYKFENNTFYSFDDDDPTLKMFNTQDRHTKGAIKPLVNIHPFDGKKSLYFTFHFIREMYGTNRPEYIMDYLKGHVLQEKYMYHHTDWKPGDLIFMDQLYSLHKRNKFTGERLLYRVTFDYGKSLHRFN